MEVLDEASSESSPKRVVISKSSFISIIRSNSGLVKDIECTEHVDLNQIVFPQISLENVKVAGLKITEFSGNIRLIQVDINDLSLWKGGDWSKECELEIQDSNIRNLDLRDCTFSALEINTIKVENFDINKCTAKIFEIKVPSIEKLTIKGGSIGVFSLFYGYISYLHIAHAAIAKYDFGFQSVRHLSADLDGSKSINFCNVPMINAKLNWFGDCQLNFDSVRVSELSEFCCSGNTSGKISITGASGLGSEFRDLRFHSSSFNLFEKNSQVPFAHQQ